MAFDITPRSFWTFPTIRSLMDETDDMMLPTTHSGLEISEDEKAVYVKAAVPGVDPKNVEITFDKGMLWIKAESQQEERDTKKKVYRQMASSFSYRVAVPGELDQNKEPEATYKHGVMSIAFAKLPQTQPKKITVRSEESKAN